MDRKWVFFLIAGDILTLGIVTLAGFATHDELGLEFARRMLATFFPLSVGWLAAAPWFGLFAPKNATQPGTLWRIAPAMFLAAPLAAVLRGALLNGPVLPVFVLVLGGSAIIGLVIWRGAWMAAASWKSR